jgi:multidrug efflux pump subunit AcrA (membrane-fusion protein)
VLTVARAFVKTGDRFDGKVAILSGLNAGDRVAASGQLKLNNGTPVVIAPENPLAIQPSATRF